MPQQLAGVISHSYRSPASGRRYVAKQLRRTTTAHFRNCRGKLVRMLVAEAGQLDTRPQRAPSRPGWGGVE